MEEATAGVDQGPGTADEGPGPGQRSIVLWVVMMHLNFFYIHSLIGAYLTFFPRDAFMKYNLWQHFITSRFEANFKWIINSWVIVSKNKKNKKSDRTLIRFFYIFL